MELVVTDAIAEARITGGVRGVGLDHELRLHPRFAAIVLRIDPVVDKDQLSISLRFISQAILRAGSWGLKCDLLPAYTIQAVA